MMMIDSVQHDMQIMLRIYLCMPHILINFLIIFVSNHLAFCNFVILNMIDKASISVW